MTLCLPGFYVGPGDPNPDPFASAANILPMNIYSITIIVCWVQYLVLMHQYGVLCYKINVNSMSTALYIDHFFVFSTPRILWLFCNPQWILESVVTLLDHKAPKLCLLSTCNTTPIEPSLPLSSLLQYLITTTLQLLLKQITHLDIICG